VTLFSVTWPCSYATLRHVNWTSFIIIIIIIIIINVPGKQASTQIHESLILLWLIAFTRRGTL